MSRVDLTFDCACADINAGGHGLRVDASGVDVCDIADDVINTIDISEAIDMLGESNVISHISWDVVKEHFDAEIKLELMELMSQVASDD